MAIITGVGTMLAKGVHRKVWSGIGNADQGTALDIPNFPDKTVEIKGTHGGATTVIEGSNDGGTTWNTLKDPQGNALSFTTGIPAMRAIQENPGLIRPSTSGGATTNLTVTIISQAAKR